MRRIALLLVTAVVVAAGCASPASHDTRTRVVASTDVWSSVAAAVAGEYAQVRPIIDNPAEDPHSYDASPADAAAIADAQLVVYNGGDYDHFVDAVLDQHAGVRSVNAFTTGGHRSGDNPHVFYDLDTVSSVTTAIAEKLAAIDSDHAAAYRANAQKFTAQLRDIAATERAMATRYPGLASIATEDVAHYLQTAAGLTDKTPEGYYKAVDADADPAPADIAAVLDIVKSHGVEVVLVNPQTDTPVTHRIVDAANAARVPTVEVRETVPAGTDYLTWQRQMVDRLGAALQEAENRRS